MLSESASRSWPAAFTALVRPFSEPQYLVSQEGGELAAETTTGLTEIDYEEQTAAYSRLAASESGPVDAVAYVGDVRAFLGRAFGGGGSAGAGGVGQGGIDGIFECMRSCGACVFKGVGCHVHQGPRSTSTQARR